jgi:hypothetical protein
MWLYPRKKPAITPNTFDNTDTHTHTRTRTHTHPAQVRRGRRNARDGARFPARAGHRLLTSVRERRTGKAMHARTRAWVRGRSVIGSPEEGLPDSSALLTWASEKCENRRFRRVSHFFPRKCVWFPDSTPQNQSVLRPLGALLIGIPSAGTPLAWVHAWWPGTARAQLPVRAGDVLGFPGPRGWCLACLAPMRAHAVARTHAPGPIVEFR